MNDFSRQKLCEIITQYSRDICNEPQRCEGLLRDFCGQHSKEVFLLVNALKKGVTIELLKSQNQIPQALILAKLTKRLQDELGITEEAAIWAVDSWGLALGVISQPRTKDDSQSQQKSTAEQKQQAQKEQKQKEEYEKKLRQSEQEVQQWKQEVDKLNKALTIERQQQNSNQISKPKSASTVISILAALSTLGALSLGIYSYHKNQEIQNLQIEVQGIKNLQIKIEEKNTKIKNLFQSMRNKDKKINKLQSEVATKNTEINELNNLKEVTYLTLCNKTSNSQITKVYLEVNNQGQWKAITQERDINNQFCTEQIEIGKNYSEYIHIHYGSDNYKNLFLIKGANTFIFEDNNL